MTASLSSRRYYFDSIVNCRHSVGIYLLQHLLLPHFRVPLCWAGCWCLGT